ncbi:MAG: RNA-binding cell elongation regulator Jag/EloR [Wujia sp.]
MELGVASTDLEYEIVDKGTSGFLGLGAKPAIIKAKKKESFIDDIKEYLDNLFKAMDIEAQITIEFDQENNNMDIDVAGPEMGILIGKRGQTLDALQYLISLFVNKKSESYIRVKLDTENYRARRKDTLENLAKNIAFKVKRTRRSFTLEPMNPYERRIIHSALQNDKYVATRSEGEEPYRKVVVYLKKN